MFRERMRAMPAELRQRRFRNIGDPRRRDRFKSTYELGVRSPFVLHGIAAYERAFGLLEETLSETGPWIVGAIASLADINLMPLAARLDYLGLIDLWIGTTAARHGLVGDGARMAELQVWTARSHQRSGIRRDAHARTEDPRRHRRAAGRPAKWQIGARRVSAIAGSGDAKRSPAARAMTCWRNFGITSCASSRIDWRSQACVGPPQSSPVISKVPNGPTCSRKATSLSSTVLGEP